MICVLMFNDDICISKKLPADLCSNDHSDRRASEPNKTSLYYQKSREYRNMEKYVMSMVFSYSGRSGIWFFLNSSVDSVLIRSDKASSRSTSMLKNP